MASVTVPGDRVALLRDGEPQPFAVDNAGGRSSFLLIGDHAGRRIPETLADLGLDAAEMDRHIAWDIGVAALGARLAALLDAVFIRQRYSRLVIDCNRDPARPDAIPEVSDGTVIPGNEGLGEAEREDRRRAIHAPYHACIAQELATRRARKERTVLVALHSFTPIMGGEARRWQAGVLHHLGDTTIAMRLLAALRERPDLIVGDNEPYRMDGTDFTVPHHCYDAAVPYVELEIRQDLIADDDSVDRWAEGLRDLLVQAMAEE